MSAAGVSAMEAAVVCYPSAAIPEPSCIPYPPRTVSRVSNSMRIASVAIAMPIAIVSIAIRNSIAITIANGGHIGVAGWRVAITVTVVAATIAIIAVAIRATIAPVVVGSCDCSPNERAGREP